MELWDVTQGAFSELEIALYLGRMVGAEGKGERGASLNTQPNPGKRIGRNVWPGRPGENVWAFLLRPGPRAGAFLLAVGWAAGFLNTGFTRRDHLYSLKQPPLPKQTQEGGLEKQECDNWSHIHLGWANTAWESDLVFPNCLRCWGSQGGDFSLDGHTLGRSLLVTAHASLGCVPLMFCTSHHPAVRVYPSPGLVGRNSISCNSFSGSSWESPLDCGFSAWLS